MAALQRERLVAHGITERFLTDGVEQVRHHAGIVTVERYEALASR